MCDERPPLNVGALCLVCAVSIFFWFILIYSLYL